jgi:hypothetical protein
VSVVPRRFRRPMAGDGSCSETSDSSEASDAHTDESTQPTNSKDAPIETSYEKR